MVVTEVSLDRFAAAVAGLIAGLLMESPAYLQRALRRPLRQDVFASAGTCSACTGRPSGGWAISDMPRCPSSSPWRTSCFSTPLLRWTI